MHSALGFPVTVKRKVSFKQSSTPIKNNCHEKSPMVMIMLVIIVIIVIIPCTGFLSLGTSPLEPVVSWTRSWASSIHLPSSQITSIRSILMLFFQLILVLQSGRFPKDFRTRILYAFLFSSNLATRSVRHSLVDFTIVPLLGYQHKSWRYSFYNILSCSLILSFFHPNIFLHALFWNTCNSCYCLEVTDRVWHPPLLHWTIDNRHGLSFEMCTGRIPVHALLTDADIFHSISKTKKSDTWLQIAWCTRKQEVLWMKYDLCGEAVKKYKLLIIQFQYLHYFCNYTLLWDPRVHCRVRMG